MIWKLLSAVLTGGISKAADTWKAVKIEKIRADTSTNETVKDLQLARFKDDQHARANAKEIRLATASYWEVRLSVALISIPTAMHYAATVFDKMYHFGWNIEPLPEPLNDWQRIIILSPFGYGVAKSGISAIAAIMLRKGGR